MQGFWESAPDDDSVSAFHDVEVNTENRQIGAEDVALGSQRKGFDESLQDPVLPSHIVSASRNRPKWRTAEHVFGVRKLEQVCEICVATAELLDG